MLLKEFNVYETLVPFKYSKIKDSLPQLELVLTGNKEEIDYFEGSGEV